MKLRSSGLFLCALVVTLCFERTAVPSAQSPSGYLVADEWIVTMVADADPDAAGEALREALIRHVTELRKLRPEKLLRRRADKYAAMGAFSET